VKRLIVISFAGFLLASTLSVRADDIVPIFNFTGTGGAYAGADPKGSLILSGTTLYGFTSAGGTGTDNSGTIFSVNTDGSDYTVLASFSADDSTGDIPHHGYLSLDGTLLVRPLYKGGIGGNGTIFSVQTDGSNPSTDYQFTGSSNSPTALGDGTLPHSGLLAGPGQTYYGVTSGGGVNGQGVIYSYTPGGSVTTLYAFDGTTGGNPHGQLIWNSANTLLLGMTRNGGTGTGSGNAEDPAFPAPGVIFSFNPATDDYHVLYNFSVTGTTPYFTDHGILALGSGLNAANIFGMTEYGGSDDKGAIFSLSENGSTSVNLLHSFAGGTADGDHPYGSLVLGPDGFFYGMTRDGGANDDGTIFRISQDGTVYTVLASFDAASSGRNPIDNIVFSADGTTLYGLADEGGSNDHGTLFSLNVAPVPEPDNWSLLLSGIALLFIAGWNRRKLRA